MNYPRPTVTARRLTQTRRRVMAGALLFALTTASLAAAREAEAPVLLPKDDLTTLAGAVLHRDGFAGKVVLFDFWATWCKPCIAAIPHLGAMAASYADSPLALVSLSADLKEDKVRDFVTDHRMSWPQVWDDSGRLANQLRITGYPTYLLFDHHGKEVYRVSGWGPAIQRQLDQRVREAVEEATATAAQP